MVILLQYYIVVQTMCTRCTLDDPQFHILTKPPQDLLTLSVCVA